MMKVSLVGLCPKTWSISLLIQLLDATEESKTETAEKAEGEGELRPSIADPLFCASLTNFTEMEVESSSKSITKVSKGRIAKSAMAKRKLKKSSMVFAKYGEKKLSRKGK